MRLFAVSDLHIDYDENKAWVSGLSRSDFVEDALILAGDISDSEKLIESCFEQLASRFKCVFYIPGNHELWVSRSDTSDSLDKFQRVLALAQSYGIHTGRRTFGSMDIVPLFSWYDFSFGTPGSDLMRSWMDFVNCRWPDGLDSPGDISAYFLRQNETRLTPSARTIVSFSHFLPRIDLMPPYIPPKHRMIYPVLGSELLDRQIRTLGSAIHIYGHSHVNRDIKIKGVRYINNAFAYPSENRIAMKELHCILEII